MNIKQIMNTIVMPFKKSESKLRKNYERACSKGYCPTTKEIENSAIKELANRLKAASEKETLTNILEWQDRNIVSWPERWPLSNLFSALLFVVVLLFLCLLLIPNSQLLWWIIVMLASSAITVFSIIVILLKLIRKIPVWDGLKNTFASSISINAFLENKLGVCRDYAKLTACLLANVYPDAEIYFVRAPQHVATGIMIDNSPPVYMLDKQLPIVTIDKWHERWHKHRWSEKTMEKVKGNCLESVDIKSYLSKTKSTEPNIEKLVTEMMTLLNIEEQTDDKAISLKMPWKKGATLYEDNEIVNYSLARRLETKISSELIRINQITRIKISRQKDDLTFLIRFSQNE
jgi:predicted transglutaminase-like protease